MIFRLERGYDGRVHVRFWGTAWQAYAAWFAPAEFRWYTVPGDGRETVFGRPTP